jgi:hypothetical protein
MMVLSSTRAIFKSLTAAVLVPYIVTQGLGRKMLMLY